MYFCTLKKHIENSHIVEHNEIKEKYPKKNLYDIFRDYNILKNFDFVNKDNLLIDSNKKEKITSINDDIKIENNNNNINNNINRSNLNLNFQGNIDTNLMDYLKLSHIRGLASERILNILIKENIKSHKEVGDLLTLLNNNNNQNGLNGFTNSNNNHNIYMHNQRNNFLNTIKHTEFQLNKLIELSAFSNNLSAFNTNNSSNNNSNKNEKQGEDNIQNNINCNHNKNEISNNLKNLNNHNNLNNYNSNHNQNIFS